jgi:hypothetical protein
MTNVRGLERLSPLDANAIQTGKAAAPKVRGLLFLFVGEMTVPPMRIGRAAATV